MLGPSAPRSRYVAALIIPTHTAPCSSERQRVSCRTASTDVGAARTDSDLQPRRNTSSSRHGKHARGCSTPPVRATWLARVRDASVVICHASKGGPFGFFSALVVAFRCCPSVGHCAPRRRPNACPRRCQAAPVVARCVALLLVASGIAKTRLCRKATKVDHRQCSSARRISSSVD